MRRPRACLIPALMVFVVTHLFGQAPPVRGGISAAGGGGLGWGRLSCGVCTSSREQGMTGFARITTAVKPGLFIGLEGNAWFHDEGGIKQRITAIGAVLYAYPDPRRGLFLKAGVGLASYRAADDVDEFTAHPFTILAGAGYEIRAGRRWSIVPFVNLLASTNAKLYFDGNEVTGDAKVTLFQAGLGLTLD